MTIGARYAESALSPKYSELSLDLAMRDVPAATPDFFTISGPVNQHGWEGMNSTEVC
jgi:hypothetical protein